MTPFSFVIFNPPDVPLFKSKLYPTSNSDSSREIEVICASTCGQGWACLNHRIARAQPKSSSQQATARGRSDECLSDRVAVHKSIVNPSQLNSDHCSHGDPASAPKTTSH